jgi:endogenous inhibitor of DNA gyrase (YacG/DUF329 family)
MKVQVDIKNHTVNCNECQKQVILENASARCTTQNEIVFLCDVCDIADRNRFSVSAQYNQYR